MTLAVFLEEIRKLSITEWHRADALAGEVGGYLWDRAWEEAVGALGGEAVDASIGAVCPHFVSARTRAAVAGAAAALKLGTRLSAESRRQLLLPVAQIAPTAGLELSRLSQARPPAHRRVWLTLRFNHCPLRRAA